MLDKKVILVVDDEKIVLDSLQALLSRHLGREYVLEFAESAEEAFEILEELEESDYILHAIVTDWLMPKMKGDEFLLKVRERLSGFRTILLSGQVSAEAVRKSVRVGQPDFFISKPWDERDLLNKLVA